MDKTPVFIILVIIVAGIFFWAIQSGIFLPNTNNVSIPEGTLLFFGDGCPHCKVVDEFVTENKIEEKIKLSKLEIPFALKTSPELQKNSLVLLQIAKKCNIDISNGVSIPFLYGNEKCYVGQDDVINFFKNEAGIK